MEIAIVRFGQPNEVNRGSTTLYKGTPYEKEFIADVSLLARSLILLSSPRCRGLVGVSTPRRDGAGCGADSRRHPAIWPLVSGVGPPVHPCRRCCACRLYRGGGDEVTN